MEFLYGFLIKLFPDKEHLVDVFFLGIFIGILIGFLLWGKFDFLRVKYFYDGFANSVYKFEIVSGIAMLITGIFILRGNCLYLG